MPWVTATLHAAGHGYTMSPTRAAIGRILGTSSILPPDGSTTLKHVSPPILLPNPRRVISLARGKELPMPTVRILVALDDCVPTARLAKALFHELVVACLPARLVSAATHVLDILHVVIHGTPETLAVAELLLENWLDPQTAAR